MAEKKLSGRKKPYTQIGIRRLKCVQCGNQAEFTWQICSDGNLYRPICRTCDVELNEMVLRWTGFLDWEAKLERYKEKIGVE